MSPRIKQYMISNIVISLILGINILTLNLDIEAIKSLYVDGGYIAPLINLLTSGFELLVWVILFFGFLFWVLIIYSIFIVCCNFFIFKWSEKEFINENEESLNSTFKNSLNLNWKYFLLIASLFFIVSLFLPHWPFKIMLVVLNFGIGLGITSLFLYIKKNKSIKRLQTLK